MPNDPIREKFEQAAIDLRLAYRDPDHGVVLFHGIDKLFDVAYRAGRASVIEETKPVAWVRNLSDCQPHCVTDLKYRTAADVDRAVQYIPLTSIPED